jgi:hypothetical protein
MTFLLPSLNKRRRKKGDQLSKNFSNSSSLSKIHKPKFIRIIGRKEDYSLIYEGYIFYWNLPNKTVVSHP